MFMNYSDLPGYQNLFLDYIYEFENVEKYFKNNFRDESIYPQVFEDLESIARPHRGDLVSIIKTQYETYSKSKKTEINIDYLASPKTIAVVTGQQLSILGGPLYTFYKTITAIKLCKQLKEKYPSYNFVPVFWMEGDDHDFLEVVSFNLIDAQNEVKTIVYDDGLNEDENRGSVGKIKFQDSIQRVFDELKENLRATEFTDKIFEKLNRFYSEGKSFESAFRDLLFSIFDEHGLIIFNPNDPLVKFLLKDIFKKEVSDFRIHSDPVLLRSAELEEVYHAQIKIKPVNLFFNDNNGRYLIEPFDEGFRLRGRRRKFTTDELLELTENSPELFSPNVMLRPICQDFLFPTAFYIAGPSEISYFAQILPMYESYKIQSPIIFPRASITVIEKNIKNLMEKFNITLHDLFADDKELTFKILNSLSETNISEVFTSSKGRINDLLSELKSALLEIDDNMLGITDKAISRIHQSLDHLFDKSKDFQERKHETIVRQLNRLKTNLYPNNSLQEREINYFYFENKYGVEIFKQIFDSLNINAFEHQIIELE
ncbi:MAG: bacillithiol biosynthesis cysteine-adding enzyme BshC [Bacteroidetes bacterium]|nr:bacillithiol biosynthesis cysteine-adding enzyme BshC [Bacteroidota bacterium]MBU1679932.1 bacillithiol biosynthesis cysteine-adding enzyme BshC [Bacteroidota bacterium]